MLTTEQQNLAKEIGQLNAAIIAVIPNHENAAEFAELVATETKNFVGSGNEVKDIAENVVDTLEAIANVLPDSADAKKQRSKKRFKAAIGVIKNFLHLFGL
jgi:hypothetical protein